ncbi:MAG: oxidoreductase [Clostridium sp.]
MKKIALITGASSGIGYETALDLKDKGFIVYGAARRLDRLNKLKDKGINILELDVTKEESMKNCVSEILKREGRIDVLVNNAGYGSFGAVEDVTMEEARRQIEVNIFGLARMTQLVLPSMRKNKFGKIVNISSMGGKMHTPFGAWYHGTKFAVEGFSDCLRMELKPFGIDVIIVEPGGIKTDWGIIAADNLRDSSKGGAYENTAKEASEHMRDLYSGKKLTNPNVIAKTIGKAVTVNKPKTRYLVGYGGKVGVIARRILSDRMFDKLIKKL